MALLSAEFAKDSGHQNVGLGNVNVQAHRNVKMLKPVIADMPTSRVEPDWCFPCAVGVEQIGVSRVRLPPMRTT
jgi:hypothetical protein